MDIKEIFTEEMKTQLIDEHRARFLNYKPYKPQEEFHNSQALKTIMSGGNQCGKSYAGAMQVAFHATGVYPEWYKGRRVKSVSDANTGIPTVVCWVVGTDSKTVRDVLQKNIIGTVEDNFTGGAISNRYIQVDSIHKISGVTGAVDSVRIRRVDGGVTIIRFKSYAQGRENLQSDTVDFIYCDEEPPQDVIGEFNARLTARMIYGNGFMFMAFTPLKGITKLVQSFWKNKSLGERGNPDMNLIVMSVYESGHMDPKMVAKQYADLSPHERRARMLGIPTAGTGMVYKIDKSEIVGYPYSMKGMKRLGALDFGRGEHYNAIVYAAYDEKADIVYITHASKTKDKSIAENASFCRSVGAWIPVAYPHDLMKNSGVSKPGDVDEKSEGWKYKELYEAEGITMTPENAKTVNGSVSVEVGICEVRHRIEKGTLKIAPHLDKIFDEFDLYRYGENGKPVKKNDDLMDAIRYLIIMLRYAIVKETKKDIFERMKNKTGEVLDDTNIFA